MRTRKLITISLPPAMLKDAEQIAAKEHRTKSELVREALRRYIDAERGWRALQRYGQVQAKKLGIRTEEDVARVVKEFRNERMKKLKSA